MTPVFPIVRRRRRALRGLGGYLPLPQGANSPTLFPGPGTNAPLPASVYSGQAAADSSSPFDPFANFDPVAEARAAEAYFGGGAMGSGQSPSPSSGPSDPGNSPWVIPPAGSQPFPLTGTIATPAVDGADHTVLTFRCPTGWDGVITQIANTYSAGVSLGQTNLTWRLFRNNQVVKGFDLIQLAFGSFGGTGSAYPFTLPAGIQIVSDDIVSFTVNNAGAPTPGTTITCYLGGWWYPRQGQ